MSVTKLVQYAIIVICTYRSPDGRLDAFFKKTRIGYREANRET